MCVPSLVASFRMTCASKVPSHRRGRKVLRKIGEVLPVDFGELSNGTRLVTWLPWVVRLGYHELCAPPPPAARAFIQEP